jgi:lysophospholipase L1-like esterase
MIRFLFILTGVLLFTISGMMAQHKKSYLALGDSYTIGESVPLQDNWPNQLVSRLASSDKYFKKPKIIATTGWTTDELIEAVDREDMTQNYDLVSLLIGVNNQYREYDLKQYEEEFEFLLQKAILLAENRKERVFVVSIPDYGVTPFGQEKDPDKIEREIRKYNELARAIANDYDILYIDIFGISKLAADRPDLTAKDDLHPSSVMYKLWVDEIIGPLNELLSD